MGKNARQSKQLWKLWERQAPSGVQCSKDLVLPRTSADIYAHWYLYITQWFFNGNDTHEAGTHFFMYKNHFSRKQTQVLRVKTLSDLIQLIHSFRWSIFVHMLIIQLSKL